MNNKIIAVCVAIIVIVAAACVVVLATNNSSDDGRSTDTTGRLMIYGNANNDDYLDEYDIETLEAIIAGEMEETPLADANQDGVIDEQDIEVVQNLINKQPGIVYYQSYHDETLEVQSCNYPIEYICVCGTNASLMMKSLGVVDRILLIDGGSKDSVMFSDFLDIPKASSSVLEADIEIVSETAVQAIITEDSASYIKNYATFESAGIDVIRLSSSSPERSIGSILTIGFLLQVEDRAEEYVQFCDGILADINEKVGDLDDSERVSALTVTMSNSVGGLTSDYVASVIAAGGTCPADWESSTQKFEIGDEWLLDPKYSTDYIIHFRTTLGYTPITDEEKQEMWDTYSVYFTDLDAYKNGNYVILSSAMPVHLRIAYLATIFYPEIFGEDYADNLHQEYIDRFIDNLNEQNYQVADNPYYIITADDVNF